MTTTVHLGIPHLRQAQAQKEVTVNEALDSIDALLNTGAIDRGLNTPPMSPAEGDVYILGGSPTGAWSGHADKVAYYRAGWKFITPGEGLVLWVNDEDLLYGWNGSTWVIAGGGGGGGGADDTITSDEILFDTETGSIQVKINKDDDTDTASYLFQTGYSSRAEFGLIGDDDFQLKVSANGSDFDQCFVVDKDSGDIEFKQDVSGLGVFKGVEIKHYKETTATNSSATGSVTVDMANGNVHHLTLTGNITTLTLSNPPSSGKAGNLTLILKQDGTGGRTITWPASVKWAGSVAPLFSSAANAVDIVSLSTVDGGTTYYATAVLNFG